MWGGRGGDADPMIRRDLRRRTPEYLSTAPPPPGAKRLVTPRPAEARPSVHRPGRPGTAAPRYDTVRPPAGTRLRTLRRLAGRQLQQRPLFKQLGIALVVLHALAGLVHLGGALPDAPHGAVDPSRNPVLQMPTVPCPDGRQGPAVCDVTRPSSGLGQVVDPTVMPAPHPQP